MGVCVYTQNERDSLLKELKVVKEEQVQLQAELEKYQECDPEVIEKISELCFSLLILFITLTNVTYSFAEKSTFKYRLLYD